MASEMSKGDNQGTVTLTLWSNALPDVVFEPKGVEAFTWKQITLMKSGLTVAMKNLIHDELRKEKEIRMGSAIEQVKVVKEEIVKVEKEEKVVEKQVEESALEKRNAVRREKKRLADKLEKLKKSLPSSQTSISRDELIKAIEPPTKEDGDEDPALAKIKAAKDALPEGLDDVDPSSMRANAHGALKEREAFSDPVVENVELGIDGPYSEPEPVEVKVKGKYANSPA